MIMDVKLAAAKISVRKLNVHLMSNVSLFKLNASTVITTPNHAHECQSAHQSEIQFVLRDFH
jgi:hypothetical protein